MEGSGSIWNKNSWHWEEKNYSKFGKEWFKEQLKNLEVIGFSPSNTKIRITEVKEIKGEATITIRKQKQIHIFNFDMKLSFEAEQVVGEEQCSGDIVVQEFFSDDMDDVELTAKIDKDSEFITDVKRTINKNIREEIIKKVKEFRAALEKADTDE